MIDPLVIRLIAVALGVLLLGAAGHKVLPGSGFEAILADYRLLPASLCKVAARLVPGIEALLGLGWLAGFAMPVVAPLTAGLFAVYGVAIAVNLLRGRVHIDCGCGLGGRSPADQGLSWLLVVRNGLLVLAALLPLAAAAPRKLGAVDWATLAAALVTAALLYGAITQLTANGAAIRTWRKTGD
jgi:hypothetical protein